MAVEIPNAAAFKKNKKLNLIERTALRILQKKIVKKLDKAGSIEKQKKQGRISMILGLLSFALLFIPFGLWLALPIGIVALIFGIKSVNGNNNVESIVGIVASGITLSLYLIVAIVMMTIALSTGF